ncbi:hypothetical protein E2C01_015375 [Portunus trituberculatus]|uniref:Uncharacterized protein n=1 Tax=Portunus trituberculatus TaxID=210409 RepID=A0A5B7DL68_PORTR|nr:hypothetical protein [Portunus trituberculatus]
MNFSLHELRTQSGRGGNHERQIGTMIAEEEEEHQSIEARVKKLMDNLEGAIKRRMKGRDDEQKNAS